MAISTPAGDPAPKHLVEALLQEAALAGLGLLLDENSGGARAISTIHALVANSAVLTAWLALAGGELVVGASEPFIELASTPIAFREAETALEIARRRSAKSGTNAGAHRTVVLLDEVDLASWLLARREAPQLEDKIRKFEASMQLNNDHIETLVVYLAHDQDVGRTARYLYVHANTVRYRRHKCEEILRAPLNAAPRLLISTWPSRTMCLPFRTTSPLRGSQAASVAREASRSRRTRSCRRRDWPRCVQHPPSAYSSGRCESPPRSPSHQS